MADDAKLTAARVNQLMVRALYGNDETKEGAVMVTGIIHTFGFHPARLTEIKPEVDELLMELPAQFHRRLGGGWSFLKGCMDKHDRQWGEQSDVEALICLGIAVDSASFPLSREVWDALPGGMPYFEVHPGE